MKRSELKVGEAYYHDRGQKWATGEGYQTGKAVVVSLTGGRNGGVIVDLTTKRYGGGEDRTSRTSAALAHLRGPYEQTLAEVTKAVDERTAAYNAAMTTERDLQRRAEAAMQRAKATGIEVETRFGYGSHPTLIQVSVGEFERLLDRISGAVVSDTTKD